MVRTRNKKMEIKKSVDYLSVANKALLSIAFTRGINQNISKITPEIRLGWYIVYDEFLCEAIELDTNNVKFRFKDGSTSWWRREFVDNRFVALTEKEMKQWKAKML